jgi:hypothetical protein
MVVDELFTLAFYCGKTCGYPFPFFPPLYLYQPWIVAYGLIAVSVLMLCEGFYLLGHVVSEIRKLVLLAHTSESAA